MGIRSMPWDEWIELDRDFEQVRRVCDYRIRNSGARLVQVLDAQPGVVESGHPAGEYTIPDKLIAREVVSVC